jgi:hypothetical protein
MPILARLVKDSPAPVGKPNFFGNYLPGGFVGERCARRIGRGIFDI